MSDENIKLNGGAELRRTTMGKTGSIQISEIWLDGHCEWSCFRGMEEDMIKKWNEVHKDERE